MRGGISDDEKKSRARRARERLRQSAPSIKGARCEPKADHIGFGLLTDEDEERELPRWPATPPRRLPDRRGIMTFPRKRSRLARRSARPARRSATA